MSVQFKAVTFIILAVLTVLLFFSLASTSQEEILAGEHKTVKIDFKDVIVENDSPLDRNEQSPLRIAVAAMISPKDTYTSYVQLLNLVGELMGRRIVFVQRKTYAEVNEMFKKNELDLAFVCSGAYVSGKEDFGMEILAVPICHGQKVYRSYLITSSNNGINSLEGLRGKIFAFTDPLSPTGYMETAYCLVRRNETAESFFKNIFFSNGHDNSIQAVADGLADGAAVASLMFEFIQARKPELTAKTIIIEKSPPFGNPPVVVHPHMEPEMKEKLRKIFFSLHEYPRGRVILENLGIEHFERGDDKEYETVRELVNFLKEKGLTKNTL